MKRQKPDNPVICRCEELKESDIVDAIRKGAVDVDGVKRTLRAGMGLCQGKTCGPLIARIIARETEKPLSQLPPVKARPPVRPVKIKILGQESSGQGGAG